MKKSAEDILTEVYESYNKEISFINNPRINSIDNTIAELNSIHFGDDKLKSSYPTYEEMKKYIDNHVTDLGQSNEYHKIPLGESYEKVCDKLDEFLKSVNQKEGKKSILDQAKELVDKGRQSEYGKPERNIGLIADLWSAYLDTALTEDDVCNMMALLKIARLKSNPDHEDSSIDLVGYIYLRSVIRESESNKKLE